MTRRAEILEVAKRLFAEQGYKGTSMRDIADATGLLPGSLYSHFRSKASLIQEILGEFLSELIEVQRDADPCNGTGAERFRRMLIATYKVCEAHPEELTILHQDWALLSTLDDVPDVHPIGVRALRGWTDVVNEGIADGSLQSSLNPELVARVTTGAIHALVDPVRYRDLPASKDAHGAEQLVEVLLAGMATNKRPRGSQPLNSQPAKS